VKKFEINTYRPEFDTLPSAFDGYRIGVVADLHDWDYEGKLEEALRQAHLDIIVFVGDIVQEKLAGHHLEDLFKACVKICPCYYVTGNHEARIVHLDSILDTISSYGCTVLEDQIQVITKNNQNIILIGQHDVQMHKHKDENKKDLYRQQLTKLLDISKQVEDPSFKILLAHRPEFFEYYADSGIDFTISGHVHGGQIRLFNKAMFGLNQGLFPKYAAGLIRRNSSYILVSRGLGHTKYTPLRINNTPELAIVELIKKQNVF